MDIENFVENLNNSEKFNLFKELAIDIFPPNSWEEKEVDYLDYMGLLCYFGLEDE